MSNRCEMELCPNWSGDGGVCPCAVLGLERPTEPGKLTDLIGIAPNLTGDLDPSEYVQRQYCDHGPQLDAHAAEVDALRKELEDARAALTELAPASLGAELERTRTDLAAAQAELDEATEGERARLASHYLAQIVCDHERGLDNPVCACSRVHLGWHPSVGAAVAAWIDHTLGQPAPAAGDPAGQDRLAQGGIIPPNSRITLIGENAGCITPTRHSEAIQALTEKIAEEAGIPVELIVDGVGLTRRTAGQDGAVWTADQLDAIKARAEKRAAELAPLIDHGGPDGACCQQAYDSEGFAHRDDCRTMRRLRAEAGQDAAGGEGRG